MISRTAGVVVAAFMLTAGCATSSFPAATSPAPAADVAAITKTIRAVNDGFAVSTDAGLNAMASVDYEVVTGLVTRAQCLAVWQADPTFYAFLNDVIEPATVEPTPSAVPPDIGSTPRGTIYSVKAHETARFNGETTPGHPGPDHRSDQLFHTTVMPDGEALLFVSCVDDNSA